MRAPVPSIEFVPLTALISELRKQAPAEVVGNLNYRAIYNAVIDGKLVPPIEKRKGRWFCSRERLPQLVESLERLDNAGSDHRRVGHPQRGNVLRRGRAMGGGQ
jgi:hypothetical protein